jgi:hypothetical protein
VGISPSQGETHNTPRAFSTAWERRTYIRLLFQAGWLFAVVMLAIHRWG